MLISLRSDGTAEMLLPSHVYQGGNVANVYVIAPFPNTTVLQVGFTLPNGTTASAPMTYAQDSENNLVVWQYTIAAAITNEAGAASVSITATTTTGQVIASQSIPFTIEATTLPVLPDTPSQDEWTLVLQYIQQNSANIATLQGQISTIEQDVATANTNASAAVSTANAAQTTAQQAETTANGYAASIETANTNASSALSTANQAASAAASNATDIANIVNGTTTVAKATSATNDGNGNNIANTYLPINAKSLPSLSNTYVTQSTLLELCNSFNLAYGESTLPLYFENGTGYSNIQGLISQSGVLYKQYNFLQITRFNSNFYMIAVYAGYNVQVQMTIPPQFFFVTGGGISPSTDNIRFKNTVSDLNIQMSPVASSGVFNYGNSTTNAPTSGSGMLLHYQFTANYATQTAFTVNTNGYIYRRTYYGGTWGNWISVLLINPTTLTPSTANGWTEGGGSLVPATAGKYFISVTDSGTQSIGEVTYNGTTGYGYLAANNSGTLVVLGGVYVDSTGTYLTAPSGTTSSQPTTVFYKQQ